VTRKALQKDGGKRVKLKKPDEERCTKGTGHIQKADRHLYKRPIERKQRSLKW